METLPITARSFEKDYHINGDNFERSYKETISGFKTWEDAEHAEDWVIIPKSFPKAMITLDRFHHQQFCLEALQEIRIGHRREVMTEVANARDDFKPMIKDLIKSGKPLVDAEGKPIRSNAAYHPERLKNNETKAELLMRSKYLLMVSPEKWTPSQRERAEILFELYPDIETAYSLTHSLRMFFAQKCDKEAGRKSIKKWYAKVGEFDNKAFNDIAAAM